MAPIKNAELEGIYTLWDSSIDPSLGLGVCWSEPVPKNIQDPIFWVWGSTVSVLVLGIGEFKPAKGTLQSTCLYRRYHWFAGKLKTCCRLFTGWRKFVCCADPPTLGTFTTAKSATQTFMGLPPTSRSVQRSVVYNWSYGTF